MKVAIVHYWFVTWRGGEKVVEQLLHMFPDADIYTHVIAPEIKSEFLVRHKVIETFIAKLPGARRFYQRYLPLMPIALEQLNLSDYDLVISSESGPSKNVITGPDSLHICYCHSPMRYVWDMYHLYLDSASKLTAAFMRPLMHYMRIIDSLSANRVDFFVANSSYISKRIEKSYRRSSVVIHPPVAVDDFDVRFEKQDFYLLFGQLTPYKRADLVVDAFLLNGKKLVVIGEGEQYESIRSKASHSSEIKVMGRQSFAIVKEYLANAKALIFPGVEDFGIVPLEAMASGTPVIAYAKGGVLDTVIDALDSDLEAGIGTGVLFYEQTIEAINLAIESFEALDVPISPMTCRHHAEKFSNKKFVEAFSTYIDKCLVERSQPKYFNRT